MQTICSSRRQPLPQVLGDTSKVSPKLRQEILTILSHRDNLLTERWIPKPKHVYDVFPIFSRDQRDREPQQIHSQDDFEPGRVLEKLHQTLGSLQQFLLRGNLLGTMKRTAPTAPRRDPCISSRPPVLEELLAD
jgi:hypothetical protein